MAFSPIVNKACLALETKGIEPMKSSSLRKTLSHVATASALSLGLFACGGEPALDVGSTVKVTNGQEIPLSEYPSVVLLYDSEAGSICTGTFVTETMVITAAHCTMGGKVDANGNVDLTLYIIEIQDAAEKKAEIIGTSTKVVRNTEWDSNGGNVNRYDLGLVFFEPGVAKGVSEIASVPAQSGDDFVIVGYGLNTSSQSDSSSAGIKRVGENSISSISGGFIQFTGKNDTTTGDGTDVSAGSGDSGGPLFINGDVAGVTSGGGWGGFGRTRSLYIDLHSSTSKAFLYDYIRY